jgi:Tfp pilus assembly protein PilF
MSFDRHVYIVALCCMFGACTTSTTRPGDASSGGQSTTLPQGVNSQGPSGVTTQPAIVTDSTAPAQPLPPETKPRQMSSAARALVNQAHAQQQAGNNAMAAATLERALRIEPDSAQLWIELARVRQDEGNSAQAENLARKALAAAGGDAPTQAAAWRVIADSLRARGRNPEAREADAKAAQLESARG